MLLLAAASQSTQPDYAALAMVLVLALIVVVMVIRKHQSKKQAPKEAPVAPVEAAVQEPAAPAPGSAGHLKLHDVEPKVAAMAMAIVADKMGKPLNELRFISIKEVK